MRTLARSLLLSLVVVATCSLPPPPYATVHCTTISIPTLQGIFYRSARVCHPSVPSIPSSPSTHSTHANETTVFPLHLLAHGDVGGGPFLGSLAGLQRQLASYGFVVAAYASCFADVECDNGESSFLEAVKTLQFFEANPSKAPIDFSKPYSASGHSTGARVVLMLAAIIDTPHYLAGTKYAADLTPSARATLSKIKAVVGDHADPMYDPKQNPDIPHWNITSTPVMIITGSKDTTLEPIQSGWRDFTMMSTADKVFLDIANATHLQPIESHPEGPWMAFFIQYFALGMPTDGLIYGNQSDSLVNAGLAAHGDKNSGGNGQVGFLACRASGESVPEKFTSYC